MVKGTFKRNDRVGPDEADMVQKLNDLPGEPPPIPYGAEGKQVGGKRSLYYEQSENRGAKKRLPSPQQQQ